MGGSTYSDEAARAVYTSRANMTPDEVDRKVFTTKHVVDKALDPKGVKHRESRDSAAHPESNAVAVFFDVTGSMGDIPKKFATEKLPGLMSLLLAKGYIAHPQILFGAIGDAKCDRSPLQVGQFESGMEMDDCLTKIHLEGGGGGQNKESYELGLYFAARHFSCDCFEKRGKKSYLFTIGDEEPYKTINRDEVERIIGDKLEADLPIEALLEELNQKVEHFHIAVHSHSYADGHHPTWKALLGERALMLEDPTAVCELIGMTIGACEGHDVDAVHAHLVDAGMSGSAATAAKKALVTYASTVSARAVTRAKVDGDLAAMAPAPDAGRRL